MVLPLLAIIIISGFIPVTAAYSYIVYEIFLIADGQRERERERERERVTVNKRRDS